MATVGQICYKVPIQEKNLNKEKNQQISGRTFTTTGFENIFGEANNLITTIGNNPTKIGIQAPAGTQFVMNGKTMMIGRTGILELEDVEITNLYFIKPGNYIEDIEATKENIDNGKSILKEEYTQNIKTYIDNITGDNTSGNNNFEQNVANLQKASTQVQEALTLLQIGTVYKVAEENSNDLSNIIIDYMF